MKTLREKVAYIRGLAEGMDLNKDEPHTKLLLQIMDLLGEVVDELEDLNERIEDAEDLVDALDEDLADVEEYVFEDDEDDYCNCHDDDDFSEFEIQCPHCNEIVCVDEDDLVEAADEELEIICPHCKQVIFSDEEEEEELDTELDESIPVD
jgi:phage FluMu protein Com